MRVEKVDYEELLPHEFQDRISRMPLAYLPLGTIEWHGPQNPFGADFIQARGLFRIAARRIGGIVLPPIWLGPDNVTAMPDGSTLIGMDHDVSTAPTRQLPGSLYWLPKGLFLLLLEAVISQARRAGFKCIMADGHYPSRCAWNEMADQWEKQYNIKLLSPIRDFEDKWVMLGDHAGKNETSSIMALHPELVDISQIPSDRGVWPQGVMGDDPRDASADFGNSLIEQTILMIQEKIGALSINSQS